MSRRTQPRPLSILLGRPHNHPSRATKQLTTARDAYTQNRPGNKREISVACHLRPRAMRVMLLLQALRPRMRLQPYTPYLHPCRTLPHLPLPHKPNNIASLASTGLHREQYTSFPSPHKPRCRNRAEDPFLYSQPRPRTDCQVDLPSQILVDKKEATMHIQPNENEPVTSMSEGCELRNVTASRSNTIKNWSRRASDVGRLVDRSGLLRTLAVLEIADGKATAQTVRRFVVLCVRVIVAHACLVIRSEIIRRYVFPTSTSNSRVRLLTQVTYSNDRKLRSLKRLSMTS
jgi:hypothetical protein